MKVRKTIEIFADNEGGRIVVRLSQVKTDTLTNCKGIYKHHRKHRG